jgi:hypothetical protein
MDKQNCRNNRALTHLAIFHYVNYLNNLDKITMAEADHFENPHTIEHKLKAFVLIHANRSM